MSAPQRPAEHEVAPLWASPPPEPSPRGWWWVAAVLMVAVAAGGLWVVFDQRRVDAPAPEEATAPGPEEAANAVRPADPQPQPEPGPAVDPVLAELRATDRFLALAEHQRARQVEWPAGMDGAWTIFSRGGYTNTESLWDDVVGSIRDDALLAGDPYAEAIWDEQQPVPAYAGGWSTEQTQHGDAFMFTVRFQDANGEPVERVHAVLIRTDSHGRGEVVARMEPFDIRREDAPDFPSAREVADKRVWQWVQQPPL